MPHKKIKSFEEMLLTDEEQERNRKEIEADKALAAYYQKIFENPETFFIVNENQDEDIGEDDEYIWDEDI